MDSGLGLKSLEKNRLSVCVIYIGFNGFFLV